jgi:LysM repeat protein
VIVKTIDKKYTYATMEFGQKAMLRRIIFSILFLWGLVIWAKPTRSTSSSKEIQGTTKSGSLAPNIQELSNPLLEEVKVLHSEVDHLTAELRRLQSDVDAIKSKPNACVIDEESIAKIEKIVKDVIQKNDPKDFVDQRVNTLSSAFSKEINGLSEKLQNVFNRIIVVLDAQQRSAAIINTLTKQPEGIAYEVRLGETLDAIAIKHKVSREAIKNLNFIIDENRLTAGQMLFIPQGN